MDKVSFFYTAYFVVCEANNKQRDTISRASEGRKGGNSKAVLERRIWAKL